MIPALWELSLLVGEKQVQYIAECEQYVNLKEGPESSLGGERVWTEGVLKEDFLQPLGSKS